MPVSECSAASALDPGEVLRRRIADRRRTRARLRVLALLACAALPLAAMILWPPPTLLVWNASASAPLGLYRLFPGGAVRKGDMVVAWTPAPARRLAAERRYLPANVPLVKRVAAGPGDRVCAEGTAISINGRTAAERRPADASGRSMPWWRGCEALGQEEYFLLTEHPSSFDGRYFGLTRGADLLGRAELLWAP